MGDQAPLGRQEFHAEAAKIHSRLDRLNSRLHTLSIESMNIMTDGVAIVGTTDDSDTAATEPDVPGAALRMLNIGITYDDASDEARLALVTQYAGTKTVNAFANANAAGGNTDATPSGMRANTIDDINHDGDPDTDTRSVSLRTASGTFLTASTLQMNGTIADSAKPQTIYYYETTTEADEKVKTYLRLTGTAVDAGETIYNYQAVTIRAGAKIPAAADYDHIHFGVWAGLDEADSDTGDNEFNGLGIGFVQNYSGMGMTEVMPNHGRATYNGNWVATVQAAGEDGDGNISLVNGETTLEANFSKMEVDVMLMDLATLGGGIDGSTFSGTKVTIVDSDGDADNNAIAGNSGLGVDSDDFEGHVQWRLLWGAGGRGRRRVRLHVG